MARKIRSDIKIGNLEKKLGLEEGAIRNPDGSNARSDKKLKTLQDEYQRMYGGPPVRTNSKAGSSKPPKKSVVTSITKSSKSNSSSTSKKSGKK